MPDRHKRKRKLFLWFGLVLVLAIAVPPFVNANLFRNRLARSISGSLGRTVTMGDVNIRLLPLPGFQIQDLVIMDDPAFSAEPLLRAESVTARLRLTSLWRGRLEIARLSLSYPSLNLVRNAEGHWNIEGLLAHASQVSAAPTSKKRPEARPRFPYIEAETGRINFKILQEKKAHALVEADFSLWQESENQWDMRLEARPTRTDANLGDTGTLRIEASFQRAEKIENTPMKVSFNWQKSQLGQLTVLLYGRDRGWRGNVSITGTLEGMPRQFSTKFTAEVEDFRRYDLASDDSLLMTADCDAKHVTVANSGSNGFRNTLTCNIPLVPGGIEVRAYDQYWGQAPNYVSARASGVPVATLVQLYRRAKRDVPHDLIGGGVFNAYFSRVNYPANNSAPHWIGQGTITDLHLSSASLAQQLHAPIVHLGFSQLENRPEGPSFGSLTPRVKLARASRVAVDPTADVFTIDPFNVDLGDAKPLTLSGFNSVAGFQLQVKGDAELNQVASAAKMFGLQLPPQPGTMGISNVDYTITAHWSGFAAPLITGAMHSMPRSPSSSPAETASNQQHAKSTKQARQ